MSDAYKLVGREAIPCDIKEWAGALDGNRRVAETITKDNRISTVFLGLNHQHLIDAPPLIFETMIFGGELDQHEWRYSTYDEAEMGHEEAVKLVSSPGAGFADPLFPTGRENDEGWYLSRRGTQYIIRKNPVNPGWPTPFGSHAEAMAFVQAKADAGSEPHQRAIAAHVLARILGTGEEY